MPSDELGEIMRSRNRSIVAVRRHERDLAGLNTAKLEEVATDLKRKNHLLEMARRNMADADRLASLGLMSGNRARVEHAAGGAEGTCGEAGGGAERRRGGIGYGKRGRGDGQGCGAARTAQRVCWTLGAATDEHADRDPAAGG